jgi:hypothetical protein
MNPVTRLGVLAFATASLLRAEPALTIYNANFAVVRETIPLNLEVGTGEVRFADATAHVEPESVILRDPAGKASFQILEQNYRNDPVTQQLLLSMFEGKTLDFLVREPQKPDRVIQGKVIRSGYQPHAASAMQRYGTAYYQSQMAMSSATSQPIIEVDGQLQFQLPGQPVFPSLGDNTILKPTLTWKIASPKAQKLDAELAYVSGGMSWDADYNLVAPEKGDLVDITGWVTIDNQSGRTFENAAIKLMAGDVQKLARGERQEGRADFALRARAAATPAEPQFAEKTFDEYHLYTLQRPSTVRDRETKQIEFVRAAGVKSQTIYVYDGLQIGPQYRGWDARNIRENAEYGTESNPKVWVMREFKNSEENRLGMPLPKGTLRFYRRDADGRLEFVGESEIDHTPKNELVRVYTGNAFDLVGERKRTNFRVDSSNKWADESFEITLRNRKKEPAEIRVIEHLYRWTNWELRDKTDEFEKKDAQTIEFRVTLKPDEERKIKYTVHYSW